jgi:hypothetical protein
MARTCGGTEMNPDLILEGVIIAVLVCVAILLFWRWE